MPPSPRHPALCPLPFPARLSPLSPPPPLELLPPLRCRSWQRLPCREPGLLLASSLHLTSWHRSSHAGTATAQPPAPCGQVLPGAGVGLGRGDPRASPPPGPECLAAVPMSHLIRLSSSPGTEDVRRKQEAARGPEEGVGGRAPGLTLRHHHHRCPPCVHCPRGHAPADGCHQAPRTSPGSAKLLKAFFCSWWMPPVLLTPCLCGTVRLLPTRCSPLAEPCPRRRCGWAAVSSVALFSPQLCQWWCRGHLGGFLK